MMTAQLSNRGVAENTDVARALVAIAKLARQRQHEQNARRGNDPLLSWERIAEFEQFRITVRCEYNMEPG